MMTNDELKKKIVEIIINAIWKDAEADYDSTDETEAGSIADALIAAWIGDVKTAQEIGASATAMAVLEAAEAEHRAARAERALHCLARSFAEALCKNGNAENLIQGFIQDAQKQAEKELQEERNENTTRVYKNSRFYQTKR